MLENPKKPISNKSFLPILLLAIPTFTYAFSVSEFFGYLKNASVTSKTSAVREESVQNLRVFEPNRVYAESVERTVNPKKIAKEEALAFEVGNDFSDNLDSNLSDNHGENAIYTVQKGDSIYSIASYFGVSVETIMTFNHMKVITVNVGDVLEVPSQNGVLYEIGKGDTLASIAKKYNLDANDISLYNGLLLTDKLAVGDELFLPGAKEVEVVKKTAKKKTDTATPSKNIAGVKVKFPRGDTSHLNTKSDINKYSTLPKYEGYYLFPVPGATRTQKMHGHNGVDLAYRMGSPVIASAGGVVSVAKTGGYNYGYGNYIIITHDNGSETIYAHLQRVDVSVGETVARGVQIGALGSTGNSTGPHVHFEIRGAFNPFAW